MLWGIIGAMDDEIELLRQRAHIEEEAVRYGCTFYRGRLEGRAVVLVCCGVGKVNAAICATALINLFGVGQIVHVGIAGALSPELGCLDIVVASDAVYHDVETGVLLDYFPHCDRFHADPALVERAGRICGEIAAVRGHRAVIGRLASGDRFISDPEEKRRLRGAFDADCVEMEGAAVAHVAYVNQIPFLILRTISDSVAGDGMLEYNQFKPLACALSSEVVCALLRASD